MFTQSCVSDRARVCQLMCVLLLPTSVFRGTYEQNTCIFFWFRTSPSVWMPSSFFFIWWLCSCQSISPCQRLALCETQHWPVCLCLMPPSVFTVFLSKCHIRLPPGWQRSPRVQLVRLCLDRLSQSLFFVERGTFSCIQVHTHSMSTCISTEETAEQNRLFERAIIKTECHT